MKVAALILGILGGGLVGVGGKRIFFYQMDRDLAVGLAERAGCAAHLAPATLEERDSGLALIALGMCAWAAGLRQWKRRRGRSWVWSVVANRAAVLLLWGAPSAAYGGYTVSRAAGGTAGRYVDHTYTTTDDGGCWEGFGGECSCESGPACRTWQEAPVPRQCPGHWFYRWTYGVHGVCHQATNNEAFYMGAPDGIVDVRVRGMGLSTALFGYWGTDGGC
jgi:hypothetical protein